MSLEDYISGLGDFILVNLDKLIFSIIAIAAGYIAYKLIGKEINRLRNQKKIEDHLAYTFKRIS